MKIILCLPGKSFSNRFLMSMISLVKECMEAGIELAVSNVYNSVIAFARNGCLGGNSLAGITQKPFGGKVEYDFMVWGDSDIVFDVIAFKSLLTMATKYGGVVSGVYKMADNVHFAVSRHFDKEYLQKHGRYEFLTADTMPSEPFCACGIGLGFCAIEHGVIEALPYPWFRHNMISGTAIHDYLSEDFSFCEDVRIAGHTITVDPKLRVGHEKTVIL